MNINLTPSALRKSALLAGATVLLALGVACTPTTEVTVAGNGESGMRGISVTGEGLVSVRPDIGMVNVGVEVTAATVAAARDNAAGAMTAIEGALADEGVDESDVQTQYFNIYPQYSYSEREAPQIVGFTVSNTVMVKVRDLNNVSAVLDAVIAAGGDAVRVNGIQFTVEDPESFLSDARREAVENARARAEILAGAAGVTLGEAISINESGNMGGDFYPAMERAGLGGDGATPISPGEQQLSVNVSVVFAITE
ncbi:MAG: SIMPL domain-containing protein [Chloroflexi bacterium]|nr:SIMPL domain-containing protein [Chloroflexota bacterium]